MSKLDATLGGSDPLTDGAAEDSTKASNVYIIVRRRNGRKAETTVQGFPKQYDPKRILRFLQKEFPSNEVSMGDAESGAIIVHGDEGRRLYELLVSEIKIDKDTIKMSFLGP